MTETEREIITNAVAVITAAVEGSIREERASYQANIERESPAIEALRLQHARELAELHGDLRLAKERLRGFQAEPGSLAMWHDQLLIQHHELDEYATVAQRGLDELVEVARAIRNTCKAHRDSACSVQVLEILSKHDAGIRGRTQRHERTRVSEALRARMDATRQARIDAAKASSETPIVCSDEQSDCGAHKHYRPWGGDQ
jgi:hypothetical protein